MGGKAGVTFGFNKCKPIKTSRKEKIILAENMATLIAKLETSESGEVYRYKFEDDVPELAFVYIHSGPSDDGKWRLSQLHRGRLMSPDHLRRIVKDKEDKAKEYKRCDAYWLLVVVDSMDRAQDREIRLDDLGTIDSAVFAKIVVYKPLFEHLVEVK